LLIVLLGFNTSDDEEHYDSTHISCWKQRSPTLASLPLVPLAMAPVCAVILSR
jgi:hypothetical protein